MNELETLALQAVEAILPYAASMTPPAVQAVILMLEKMVPIAAAAAPAIIASVQNIVTALRGSGAVTADQVAQLDAQATAMEAALDAQAAIDGLV